MIAHKSNLKNGAFSGFYLFLGVLVILMLLAVASTGILNPNQTTSTPSSSSGDYQTYRSAEYGYAISFPAGWQVVNQAEMGVFTASSVNNTRDYQGGTNFSRQKMLNGETTASAADFSKVDVVAYKLEDGMTAREFLLSKSSIAPDGVISDIKVAGKDAVRVEVQMAQALDNHLVNQNYISVFVTNGKYGYIIAGFAPTSVFDSILNSFQAL